MLPGTQRDPPIASNFIKTFNFAGEGPLRNRRNFFADLNLGFINENFFRFGGCVTFKYRVHATRPTVTFTVRGRFRVGNGRFSVPVMTIRAIDEGPYWQTAHFTVPPRPSSGSFTVCLS